MKRVQVVLTPTESKKLIAEAVVRMDSVQKALQDGIVAIHPSSSTYFIVEAITGQRPKGMWLVGMICRRGTCLEGLAQKAFENDKYQELTDPANFPFSYVFKKGRLEDGLRLQDVLSEMGRGDVYIKGVNAFDTHGYVASLLASLAGGTIGQALAYQKKNDFEMIYLAGIEKLVPSSLADAAKETGRPKTADALGSPCGLLPIKASPVTEVKALQILAGVEAVPIAAGGVGGGEGSVMMVVKGAESNVDKAMALIKEVKGARLPEVILPDCRTCHFPGCYFAGSSPAWG